jgi:hypothetical protein
VVTEKERQRLIRQWSNPEIPAIAIVAKCVAGLLIIAAIAAIGVLQGVPESGEAPIANAGGARVTASEQQSYVESIVTP